MIKLKTETLKKLTHLLNTVVCLLFVANTVTAQDTLSRLSISGYADAYYAYYTDSVGPGNFQKFPTVSPRSNSIGLNVALLDCKYETKNVRVHVAFHYGDLVKSSWSPALNNIARAHVGVRLAKNLWIDAGMFRTHFGTELLYPRENPTSSVAIGTYYEPYYESGARIEYTPTEKLSIDLYALNGYGIYEDNNKKKSVGVLVSCNFSEKFNLNYSNYIGDDTPDSIKVSHLRIHNNLYFNLTLGHLFVQGGGDFCMQEHSNLTSTEPGYMYSALLTAKLSFLKKFAVYGRGEILQDANGYMTTIFKDYTGRLTGYKLWSATGGIEFKPAENAYMRLEGRDVQMDENQQIFYWDGKPTSTRYEVMATMGVSFEILKRVHTKK
jgi:hypothetical protein